MGGFESLKRGQISSGYWGNHTGSIDWCEINYAHSQYIAEFWNTITNIFPVVLGLWAARTSYKNGIPLRYTLLYSGLSLIGVGSLGFHMSLRWEWQMLDELPMIYVVSYAAYLLLDDTPGFDKPRWGIWGLIILAAWDVFVTFSYIAMPNPIYHQIAFACLLISTVARKTGHVSLIPAGHPGRRGVIKLMTWGVVLFASAFLIWNIDNICCSTLRRTRARMGPFGFMLELHSYWHAMTCYSPFLMFTASIYLQLAIKSSPDEWAIEPELWFPLVKKASPKQANGKANGSVNGKVNGGVAEKVNGVDEKEAPLSVAEESL